MSDLLSSLKDLKAQLSSITINESDYVNVEKKESSEEKLKEITRQQDDIIKVEAGGKIYETTKATIRNCPYDNVLKDQLEYEEKNKNNSYQSVYYYNNQPVVRESPPFFVDIDKKLFRKVLNFIRYSGKNSGAGEKFTIFYKKTENHFLIQKQILRFFKNNDQVMPLINLYETY
jgi:hypothetical protein